MKTPASELRRHVTEELITYLGSGSLNTGQYVDAVDYSGLNIESFDELKQLHFVLYSDVVEYIDRLPDRLRRIKTITRQQSETVRGGVRGAIDWQQTIRERGAAGYDDPTLFVVSNPAVEYDIPENRVLKKLLAVIAEPLTTQIESINQEWRSMWDDRDIVGLQQTLKHNIYLDALPAPEEISLSERDLDTARRSRHQLYSEGHRLYRLYDDLMNDRFAREPVRDLLNETLIVPDQDHKVFELFCVFGVLRRLQSRYRDIQVQRIDSDSSVLASFDSPDQYIEVYYDQNGPLRFFEEYPSAVELDDPTIPDVLYRNRVALDSYEDSLETFLSKGTQHSFFNGRPDLLILRYEKRKGGSIGGETLSEVLIGEMKYTQSASTFSQGLRQLFEYIYFVQSAEGYLFDIGNHNPEITGILCTDSVDTETTSTDSITHLTTQTLLETCF
ncbi:hypothetical protein [Halobellus inordinatus]|uniref:hypothetical protein n=1 Tax=Halobellus inordinatus TaxID=1126236 RepID=UPI002114BB87|nr:hypothetical protein [Halobellus ramosii]